MRAIGLALAIIIAAWAILHKKWRERVQSVIYTAEKIAYDDATRRGW